MDWQSSCQPACHASVTPAKLTTPWLGLGGWQWLFLIEGAPAALLGLVMLWLVPSVSAEAPWLGPMHRCWLSGELARERADDMSDDAPRSIWRVLVDRDVLGLTAVNIGAIAVTNGLAIWQPQVIHSFELTTMQTGLLNALPFALGSLALFVWSWHSDAKQERRLHTAAPLLIGCLALAATLVAGSLTATILILCVAVSAASMIKGPFWALATEIIPARAGAAAFGQITSLTNIGAFIGTWGIGAITQATGGYTYAMMPLMLLAFVCALAVGRKHARRARAGIRRRDRRLSKECAYERQCGCAGFAQHRQPGARVPPGAARDKAALADRVRDRAAEPGHAASAVAIAGPA